MGFLKRTEHLINSEFMHKDCDCVYCLSKINTETLIDMFKNLKISEHNQIKNITSVIINRLNDNYCRLYKEFHLLKDTYKEDKEKLLFKINLLDVDNIKEVQNTLTIDSVSKNSLIIKLMDKVNSLESRLDELKNNPIHNHSNIAYYNNTTNDKGNEE